ncbi:MAG: helix-turn-helix transcriptional regulator [Verrucomicrobia bacterium]|nr:helix-turn-helix transcriptional regulator [Verrucomicrobiota bacterium]
MTQENDGMKDTACVRGGRFKGNLRFLRELRHLTVKEAAGKLGVAQSAWSQWENGRRFPDDEWLDLIAMTLGLPTCCLFSSNLDQCQRCRATPGNSHPGTIHRL